MEKKKEVGHTGFEPVTSALSRQRSKPTELMTLKLFAKDKPNFETRKLKLKYCIFNLQIK